MKRNKQLCKASVFSHRELAGYLVEYDNGEFVFEYLEGYNGPPISLTMAVAQKIFTFKRFPAFFEGLLPEGERLEALLVRYKIDRSDYFSILLLTGSDLVGAVEVEKANE